MLYSRTISTLLTSVFVLTFAHGARGEDLTLASYNQTLRQALTFSDQRDFDHASSVLQQALDHLTTPEHVQWEATILSFLGSVYQRAGRYSDAEQVLNKSIRELTQLKGPQSPGLIGPLANLGALYYEAGQVSKAEQFLGRALELQRAHDKADPSLTAMLLTNLGSIHFSEHKNALAQANAEEALQKFEIAPDTGAEFREGTARNYALLGAVSMEGRRDKEAENYLHKALDIWNAVAGPDDPRRAEALANLGIFYSTTGDLEKSEDLFKQAHAVFENIGGDNAFIQHFLAEYYGVEQKLGHKKQAKLLSKQLQHISTVSAQNTISRDVIDASAFR